MHLHARDAFLDDRCRPQISAAEFLGQLLAFRKAHFGRWISDALNEHRGIMRSFAATLRAWRRCCTIFVVRRMSIVPRIWSQFITRDYWFTIARVNGQTRNVIIVSCYVCTMTKASRYYLKKIYFTTLWMKKKNKHIHFLYVYMCVHVNCISEKTHICFAY